MAAYAKVAFLNSMDENDPKLVHHIRQNLLITPAPANVPYNFSSNKADFSEGQVAYIKKIFNNKVCRICVF